MSANFASNNYSHLPFTEIKLSTNSKEREKYENLSDIYAIIVTLEHLEKAFIRDAISEDMYTPACMKLIAHYKTGLNLLSENLQLEDFMKQYKLTCPAALKRLSIGIPATIEHTVGVDADNASKSAKNVAETVQLYITLMDSLKLNMAAVDQIHPYLSDLITSINKLSFLSSDFEGKIKIREWLVALNKMKASDELSETQVRQLLFDLENSHSAFYRSLSK